MSDSTLTSRRKFLQSSLVGAGAISSGLIGSGAWAADGRKTDTVRLTWGYYGLTLIAKERGEFEKALKAAGIKVEWLGPFPNHAPTLQAVVGGSADFGFGGSTTPARHSSSPSSCCTSLAPPRSSQRKAPASKQ